MKKTIARKIFSTFLGVNLILGTTIGNITLVHAEDDITQREGSITIFTDYTGNIKTVTDYVISELQKIYPNVTFEVEQRTDEAQTLKTRAATGDLPDIIECTTPSIIESLVVAEDIVPLTDVMEEKNFEDLYIEGAFKDYYAEDGNVYAIIEGVPSPFIIFYNTRVFEENNLEPPKNYDEFKHVVETLVEKDIIPFALFAHEEWPGVQLFDMAVTAEQPLGVGGVEDGKAKFTDDAYVNAAHKIAELVDMGLIGKGAFNTDYTQAGELMKTGKAAMMGIGSWFFADVADSEDEIGYFSYNPFADAGQEEEAAVHASGGAPAVGKYGGYGYAVSAETEDVELAKHIVLDYVHFRSIGNVKISSGPTYLKESITPDNARTASYEAYCQESTKYTSFTKYAYGLSNAEFQTQVCSIMQKLYAGGCDPDELIEELNAIADETVDQ